jgi:hypothetical protein
MTATQALIIQAIGLVGTLYSVPAARAYEVAVGLGSFAGKEATLAMEDRSQWPVVADLSWGPLANFYPIVTLERSQQEAILNNFKQRRAISEVPYPNIDWNSTQPDIAYIEDFGFSTPYVLVLYEYNERVQNQGQATADGLAAAGVIDSMLTRDEILLLKQRFPNKKIIMNARAWTRDSAHFEKVQDILDAVCIEFMPHNSPYVVGEDVAPFAAWAYKNNKVVLLLMPPMPEDYLGEDTFVKVVTRSAQAIYDANVNILPKGWMKSDKIIFAPSNYSWSPHHLPYVSEDAKNSVLAAVKSLMAMRPQLDAGPAFPGLKPEVRLPQAINFLLQKKKGH